MIRVLRVAAVLALAATASGASAAETTIGGVSVALPTPTGFCEMSTSNPTDNVMITTVSGIIETARNKLLGLSADCRQLADWRAKKRSLLNDYQQFQIPLNQIDKLVASPKSAIQGICSALRAQGKDILVSKAGSEAKSAIESTLEKVKLNSMTFVGVLAEDDTACYGAGVGRMQTDSGADKTQVFLNAIAVVKSKFIFVYRYAVYSDPDITLGLLTKLRGNVAALYAANR
jgi:hypothetical protein